MILKHGDVFKSGADAICVTTNGVIKSNGEAVMGAGVAKRAKQLYPTFPKRLAEEIRLFGNNVNLIDFGPGETFFSFPTKHDWKDNSHIELIKRSAQQLKEMVDGIGFERVALPPPGCGHGGFTRAYVYPILEGILDDDRFEIWDLRS